MLWNGWIPLGEPNRYTNMMRTMTSRCPRTSLAQPTIVERQKYTIELTKITLNSFHSSSLSSTFDIEHVWLGLRVNKTRHILWWHTKFLAFCTAISISILPPISHLADSPIHFYLSPTLTPHPTSPYNEPQTRHSNEMCVPISFNDHTKI